MTVQRELYDSNNPKFRRAYIRERLLQLKAEREVLVAERNAIEKASKLVAEAKQAAVLESSRTRVAK